MTKGHRFTNMFRFNSLRGVNILSVLAVLTIIGIVGCGDDGNGVTQPTICQVTNENDSGDGSLRQVLADAVSTGCTMITFDSGVSTITLSSQLEIFFGTVTIDGGTPGVTVSGNNSTRVFYVGSGADVTFQNLTITNGQTNGNDDSGGGIYNTGGTVTIESGTTVSNNTASDSGGGICNSNGTLTISGTVSGNTAIGGGGIRNTKGGMTTITSSGTVSGNTANYAGGGICNRDDGQLIIHGTVSGNTAEYGGGIRNTTGGMVTFENGNLVENNTAGTDGGGIYNEADGTLTGIPNYGSGNTPNNCAGPGGCP